MLDVRRREIKVAAKESTVDLLGLCRLIQRWPRLTASGRQLQVDVFLVDVFLVEQPRSSQYEARVRRYLNLIRE